MLICKHRVGAEKLNRASHGDGATNWSWETSRRRGPKKHPSWDPWMLILHIAKQAYIPNAYICICVYMYTHMHTYLLQSWNTWVALRLNCNSTTALNWIEHNLSLLSAWRKQKWILSKKKKYSETKIIPKIFHTLWKENIPLNFFRHIIKKNKLIKAKIEKRQQKQTHGRDRYWNYQT